MIAAAVIKSIPRTAIASGAYAHLGLTVQHDRIVANGPVLPTEAAGKWSSRNLQGWDRVRKDWPRVMKTYVSESPNFGDAATYGTHMHVWQRQVAQHQVFEPQGMTIEPKVLADTGGSDVVVRFLLSPARSWTEAEFDTMLLWSLNVRQENVGATGVVAAEASEQDHLRTIQLDWEVFPPGTVDEVLDRMGISRGSARPGDDTAETVEARIRVFARLKPVAYLRGRGSLDAYIGAQFADDLVLFENLRHGNALYILHDQWSEVSKRSRHDLLRDHDAKFDRIIHTAGWEQRLQALLELRLEERGLIKRRRPWSDTRRR